MSIIILDVALPESEFETTMSFEQGVQHTWLTQPHRPTNVVEADDTIVVNQEIATEYAMVYNTLNFDKALRIMARPPESTLRNLKRNRLRMLALYMNSPATRCISSCTYVSGGGIPSPVSGLKQELNVPGNGIENVVVFLNEQHGNLDEVCEFMTNTIHDTSWAVCTISEDQLLEEDVLTYEAMTVASHHVES